MALGAGLLTVYLGLPYLLAQRLGLGLVREGRQQRRELALTFDDGPDPATTPAVLDALADAGVHATFFVTLPRAEARPDLLRRILAEGHEAFPHAVKHRHAWIRTPWSAALEPVRAARRLAELTGRPARYYRPPHGSYTLATLLGMRWAGVVGAHWSVESGDWQPGATPERTLGRLLARVYPGAVVVLHDAGAGARVTVPMLPELLRRLREREYAPVRLSELEGAEPLTLRGLPRRLVGLLDPLYDWVGGNRPIDGRRDTMYRAGALPFPMPDLTLHDGVLLKRGAKAIEFHANNPLMVDIGMRQMIRRSRQDFRLLARDIRADPDWRDAEAVFCISALRAMLAALHFETHPVPASARRRLRLWSTVLRLAYRTPILNEPKPVISALSMAAFMKRYGGEE